jgi:hypothetical protein
MVGSLSRDTTARAARISSVVHCFIANSYFAFAFWTHYSSNIGEVSYKKRKYEVGHDVFDLSEMMLEPFSLRFYFAH